jgi:hypothetical protein
MQERQKLTDILLNTERAALEKALGDALSKRGTERTVLRGDYRCLVLDGRLGTTRAGKLEYVITLEICEGDFADRRLWHHLYLSSDGAIRQSLPDLKELGIDCSSPGAILAQLDRPLPEGIIVQAKVVVHRDDDGVERNKVKQIRLVGIEPPEPEPFASTPSSTSPVPSDNDKAAEPDDGSTWTNREFDWGSGEQQDPPAPGRGRGAYSQP